VIGWFPPPLAVRYLGEVLIVLWVCDDGWVWCLWPPDAGGARRRKQKRRLYRHWHEQLEPIG
jgi:hypothetical protein